MWDRRTVCGSLEKIAHSDFDLPMTAIALTGRYLPSSAVLRCSPVCAWALWICPELLSGCASYLRSSVLAQNGRTTKPAGLPAASNFRQNPGRRTKDRRLSSRGLSYTPFAENARLNSVPPTQSPFHFRGNSPILRRKIRASTPFSTHVGEIASALFCMVSCILRNFTRYIVLYIRTSCFLSFSFVKNEVFPPPPRHFLWRTAITVHRQTLSLKGKKTRTRRPAFLPNILFSAATVVAATAVVAAVVTAIVAAAPTAAAAAAQDDDEDDDPQTASAAPTVIAAPHMSTSRYESLEAAVCRSQSYHMRRGEMGSARSGPLRPTSQRRPGAWRPPPPGWRSSGD